jgi:dipeptidyl aminopeptidase/acylaminoacyl peptidase
MRKYLLFLTLLIMIGLLSCSTTRRNSQEITSEANIKLSMPTQAPAQKNTPGLVNSITPSKILTPTPTLEIPGNSQIAFSTGQEIALIPASGGIPTSIISTNERVYYDSPSWSPTGEQIVFTQRGPAIGSKIYLINRDGSDLRLLRSNAGEPAWSPDGENIAFVNYSGLFVTKAKGTGLLQVVKPESIGGGFPSWSPDGKKLIFLGESAKIYGPYKIYMVDSDGKNLHPLTEAIAGMSHLAWSPDGKKIYFRSFEGCGDIIELDIEKGSTTNLTNTPKIADVDPALSADGKYISYSTSSYYPCDQSEVHGYEGDKIYIMRNNGQNATQLLNATGYQSSWWPISAIRISWKYRITQAGANLNVRELPVKSAKSLATLPDGTIFSVLNGPQNSDGFSWWRIRTDNGIEGWIADVPGWYMFESSDVSSP